MADDPARRGAAPAAAASAAPPPAAPAAPPGSPRQRGVPPGDPTAQSLWGPLRLLLTAMDDDIARLYQEAGVEGLKPSYVMELLRLHHQGPMTITELAESVGRTHSALSQKVAAMRRAGLVRTVAGADARSKKVVLTAKSRRIMARLAAEWRATEAAVAGIEQEIPYPLSQVVEDIRQALDRRGFHDRIASLLERDPSWR